MNFFAKGHGLRVLPRIVFCAALSACLSLSVCAFAQEAPRKVSSGELQSMLQKGEAAAVNIMSGLECRDHQIPGSVCIPCEDFAQKAPALLKGRPQQVILYGDRDTDAEFCLKSLGALSREFKITVLEGGLAGWKRAGLEAGSTGRVPRAATTSISTASLKALIAQGGHPVAPMVIDIRPAQAFNAGHISGALNIPMNQLPARYFEIPPDRPIVIADDEGRRSFLAASYLVRRGFENVQRLRGGMAAWNREAARGKKK